MREITANKTMKKKIYKFVSSKNMRCCKWCDNQLVTMLFSKE